MRSTSTCAVIIALMLQSAPILAVDTVYTADGRLLPSFDAPGDYTDFGASLALNNVLMAIGAPAFGESDSGAVFVQRLQPYVPDASLSGSEIPASTFRRITPTRPVIQERFGSAVAADNGMLVVGAPCRNLPPPRPGGCSGVAYVFDLVKSLRESAILLPNDLDAFEEFGASVAISSSWLAIGAPGGDGRVFLYQRDASSWVLKQILYSRTGRGGRFGESIALRKDVLAVGAPKKKDSTGEMDIFQLGPSGNWTAVPAVYAGTNGRPELFGQSVALSENARMLVVGAPSASLRDGGYASVYRRAPEAGWVFSAKISASDCDGNCRNDGGRNAFGRSVSISNDTILVGASKGGSYTDSVPAAFIFKDGRNQTQRKGTQWTAIPLLGSSPYSYGNVVVNGNRALVSIMNCGLRVRSDTCVWSGVLENRFLSFPLAGHTPYTATVNSAFDHSVRYGAGTDGRYYSNDTTTEIVAFTGERGMLNCGRPSNCQLSSDDPSYRRHVDDSGGAFVVNSNYSGAGFPEFLSYNGHPGYDYQASMNTAILAPADGVAYIPSEDPVSSESDPQGAPNRFSTLAIDHRNGYTSWFLHMGDRGIPGDNGDFRRIRCGSGPGAIVRPGDFIAVKAGCRIGFVGDKGLPSSAPHLHYEVRVGAVIDMSSGTSECKIGICRPIDPYGWDPLLVAPKQRDPEFYFPNLTLWKK